MEMFINLLQLTQRFSLHIALLSSRDRDMS